MRVCRRASSARRAGGRGPASGAVGQDGAAQVVEVGGEVLQKRLHLAQHAGAAEGGAQDRVVVVAGRDALVQVHRIGEGEHQAAAGAGALAHQLTRAKELVAHGLLPVIHHHLLGHQAAVVFGQVGGGVVESCFAAHKAGHRVQALAQGLLGRAVGLHLALAQRQQPVPAAAQRQQPRVQQGRAGAGGRVGQREHHAQQRGRAHRAGPRAPDEQHRQPKAEGHQHPAQRQPVGSQQAGEQRPRKHQPQGGQQPVAAVLERPRRVGDAQAQRPNGRRNARLQLPQAQAHQRRQGHGQRRAQPVGELLAKEEIQQPGHGG